MTTPRRRGHYAKTPAVRESVLEVCVELLSEAGFRGVTMAEVARRAGLSNTGLLHHFRNKEELLLAVLERRYRHPGEDLAAEHLLDPDKSPKEALESMVRHMSQDQPAGIRELSVILTGEAIRVDHPAHVHIKTGNDVMRHFFSRVFTSLRERGEIIVDVPPELLATMLTALLDGLRTQWLYNPAGVHPEEAAQGFLKAVVRY